MHGPHEQAVAEVMYAWKRKEAALRLRELRLREKHAESKLTALLHARTEHAVSAVHRLPVNPIRPRARERSKIPRLAAETVQATFASSLLAPMAQRGTSTPKSSKARRLRLDTASLRGAEQPPSKATPKSTSPTALGTSGRGRSVRLETAAAMAAGSGGVLSPKKSPKEAKAAASAKGKSGSPPSKGGSKKGSAQKEFTLMTAAELRRQQAAFESQAAELERNAESVKSATFERRLGAALLAKTAGKPLADVVRAWDKNGDGDISVIEFRACVRNSLGVKADNKEIDELFSSLDDDGGGSLDLKELKSALHELKDASAKADGEAKQMREEAMALRGKAVGVATVAEATEGLEATNAHIGRLQESPDVASRLGAILVAKSWKVTDLISRWDKDGDGTVSKEEFRQNVSEMGVPGTPEEVDALFDTYDSDGGGSLDLHELKPTIRKLIDAAQATKTQIGEASKAAAGVRAEVTKAQRELAALRAAEAEEWYYTATRTIHK